MSICLMQIMKLIFYGDIQHYIYYIMKFSSPFVLILMSCNNVQVCDEYQQMVHNFSCYAETTKEFVDKLELKAGQKVLDVGCGIGGGDFYMADTFEVEVMTIDLSINMISFALERDIG